MATTTPSDLLLSAADRIRDLAAEVDQLQWHATPGPPTEDGVEWSITHYKPEPWVLDPIATGIYREADARWIAALSPALAPDLSALLVALDARDFDAARVIAQRLSSSILGSGVDTHG